MTPVMQAAKEGHREVFDLLVKEGANLSLVDDEDRNILHFACIGQNVEIVKYVLTLNIVGINSRDINGWTPVMNTASDGERGVFNILVDAGADLSLVNNNKETILHVACQGGNVEIVKVIITSNAVYINSREKGGSIPVMSAARAGHKAVFDILVEAGADLSLVNNNKETILHVACQGGNVEIVKVIITSNAVYINSREKGGSIPVMSAARAGHKAVFDILVEAGADLSQVTNKEETIFHMACVGGNVEIIKCLMTHGIVDIDSRDRKGWTPVMHAVNAGHKEAFDVLVEAGADVPQVGNNKETILHVSCVGGNVEIIKYLLRHDIVGIDSLDADGWTPVMHAVNAGHKQVFDLLVEAGADLSPVTDENESILHLACGGGNIEIIRYLVKHTIVDIDSRDDGGFTPVMHAAMDKSKDVFSLLVEGGADLSLLGENNEKILHLACSYDSVEIVKQLLTQKLVDINSRDGDGCTSAMIAAREGHEAVFNLLVEHEADLTITTDAGDNILHMACKGGNVHIVKYVSTRHIVKGLYKEDDPCRLQSLAPLGN
ncbi:putative ankyrin repeat protein RF_0381 [Haliotis asinina]|uniref:putative ankyrin repeat protein RF_0381 n=1 Tax=Haliotis asinina TaxID=109174 RepID=UPI0035326B82